MNSGNIMFICIIYSYIVGQLTVEYVVIKPIPDYPWDTSISYAKHWEQRWSGLDVGHRGLGTSFKFEMKKLVDIYLKTTSFHHVPYKTRIQNILMNHV